MKILRVVGIGLLIIILKFLMTDVFQSFENALIAFFSSVENISENGLDIQNTANVVDIR